MPYNLHSITDQFLHTSIQYDVVFSHICDLILPKRLSLKNTILRKMPKFHQKSSDCNFFPRNLKPLIYPIISQGINSLAQMLLENQSTTKFFSKTSKSLIFFKNSLKTKKFGMLCDLHSTTDLFLHKSVHCGEVLSHMGCHVSQKTKSQKRHFTKNAPISKKMI